MGCRTFLESNQMIDYDIEESTRDTWDRITGYVLNVLAGVGLLAFTVFLAFAMGYYGVLK